jgi:hypothetical protein
MTRDHRFFDTVVDADWLLPGGAAMSASPPPWSIPPSNVRPRIVELTSVLVNMSDVVMWLDVARAFSTGCLLQLQMRWRNERIQLPFLPGRGGRQGFCLGIELEDGQRTLAGKPVTTTEKPRGPILAALAARHGPDSAVVDLWLWPSIGGKTTWVVEWARCRIAETRTVVDLTPVANAGASEEILWER